MMCDQADAATASTGAAGTLRVLACGSACGGMSVLIGSLFHNRSLVPGHPLQEAIEHNQRFEAVGDGGLVPLDTTLQTGDEQRTGAAYRYFATPLRSFMVAEAPGHELYARSVATGASAPDLAILLVDVREGISSRTQWHSHIVHQLGIRHAVLVADITKGQRARAMGQKPCCLWFTGLSGSGKSTVANMLEGRLFAMGRTLTSSMATMSGTVSTATWDFPKRIASRTSAGPPMRRD